MKRANKLISLVMTLVFLISCLSLPATVSAAEPFSETLFTETFSKDSVSAGTGIGVYNSWTEESASGTSISVNTIKAETAENMVGSIFLKGSSESGIGTQRLIRSFDSMISSESDIMELSLRIKRIQDNANTLMMTLKNAGVGNTNIIMYLELDKNRIRTDKMQFDTPNGYITPAGINGKDEWYNLKFVINSKFETEVYVDGVKVRTWAKATSGITAFPQGIYFSTTAANWGGQKDTTKDAEFQIDDISVIAYNNEYAVSQVMGMLAADGSVVKTATNLELPTVLNGVAVTWTVTSGTGINANGVITKGDAEQTATLKATVGEGDAAQSRNYTVKVLPSNVALYEDFSSVLNNADSSIGGFNGWTDEVGNGVAGKSTWNSTNTIKLEDGNLVASVFRNGVESVPTDGLGTRKFHKSFALNKTGYMEIGFRIKRTTENAYGIQMILDSSTDREKIAYIDLNDGRIRAASNLTSVGFNGVDTWYDLKFVVNSSDYSKTVVCVNGNPVGTINLGITVPPTKITFNTTRSGGSTAAQKDTSVDAELLVDDIVIAGYTDAIIEATPKTKSEGIDVQLSKAEMIFLMPLTSAPAVNNIALTLADGYTSEKALPEVSAVTWDSTDKRKVTVDFTGEFDYLKKYNLTVTGSVSDTSIGGTVEFKTRDKAYVVRKPLFFNGSTDITEAGLLTGTITAKLPIRNETASPVKLFAVLGSFDSSGKMTDVDYKIQEISAENLSSLPELEVEANAAGKLKLYVFETAGSSIKMKKKYEFDSMGLSCFDSLAPVTATGIETKVNYDKMVNGSTVNTAKIDVEAPDGDVSVLVLCPGVSIDSLQSEGTPSYPENEIEYIGDIAVGTQNSIEYIQRNSALGDYTAYVSGGVFKTYTYYNTDIRNAMISAVRASDSAKFVNYLHKTSPVPFTPAGDPAVYVNDILNLDVGSLEKYYNLLDPGAVRKALTDAAYANVNTLQTAVKAAIIDRENYEQKRINIIKSVNDTTWDKLEDELKKDKNGENVLNLNWTGDYALLNDKVNFYKKLDIDYTFATAGKTSDELISDVRNTFASLATSCLAAQKQGEGKVESGGGGGGGGMKIHTPITQPESSEKTVTFNDLSTVPWAQEAINELVARGVLNGVGNNEFAPDEKVTREQFIKMLVLALNFPLSNETSQFIDVSAEDWFGQYVITGYECGIIQGSNGAFGTGRPITRAEMTTMCYRALQTLGHMKDLSNGTDFADEDSIPEYALEAVTALSDAQIINGVGNNLFAPFDSASRAQAAKIIYGITERIGGLK